MAQRSAALPEPRAQIASQVLPRLGRREVERLGAVSGERLDTWDLWLRARHELSKGPEAAAEAIRLLETSDYANLHAVGAATLAQVGRSDEAQQRLSHILAVAPTATADSLTRRFRWEDQSHIQHLREGLVLAGLPTS